MIVLFDIDGTLTTGGPAKVAFRIALQQVFGTVGSMERHCFAGKTDTSSLRAILTSSGLSDAEIEAATPRFEHHYLTELEARIGVHPVTVLPGARELVAALAGRPDVHLGLVTGNIAGGARFKLLSAGLWHHFPVGAFGCDHESRNELPRVALDRAAAYWNRPFSGEQAVVIGDTPLDVECGKAVGAATVAVATGQFSMAGLLATDADHVRADLADTAAVIEILNELHAIRNPRRRHGAGV